MSLRVAGEGVLRWTSHLFNHSSSIWRQGGVQIWTSAAEYGSSSSRSLRPQRSRATLLATRLYSHQEGALTDPSSESAAPFRERLQACGSPADVLDLYGRGRVPRGCLSSCLLRMWDCAKRLTEEQRRGELELMLRHPQLEELLRDAVEQAGRMRTVDLAYTLLGAVKLGVPQRSRAVQMLLRACQENINAFDEKSLSVLASSLENMEDGANVRSLKEAIRLLVEARLPSIQKVLPLQSLMRLLGQDTPSHLKKKLERKALAMSEEFTLPNCQHMISTMAKMMLHSRPLLHLCSRKITERLPDVPFSRMYMVLKACSELNYRDPALLHGLSDYVASSLELWSNKQLLLYLSVFEELTFSSPAFMEALGERIIQKPDALTLRDLLRVLKAYSSLNYDLGDRRQHFLEAVVQALHAYLPKMDAPELLSAVYRLCLLGHFPAALLQRLLLDNTVMDQLRHTEERFQRSQRRMLRTVDLCMRLDRPLLTPPPVVPPTLLGDPTPDVDQPANPVLSRALQAAMEGGGAAAGAVLQEALVVESFYILDAVITKALPADPSSPLEGSERIAVVCVPHSHFCYGTSHPRGNLAVMTRHLRILGYTPVTVINQELESVAEEDRTEFLRRLIFPDLDDNQ